MEVLGGLGEAFLLGLATPLGAVCVLPIYPGFLVYLSYVDEIRPQISGKYQMVVNEVDDQSE